MRHTVRPLEKWLIVDFSLNKIDSISSVLIFVTHNYGKHADPEPHSNFSKVTVLEIIIGIISLTNSLPPSFSFSVLLAFPLPGKNNHWTQHLNLPSWRSRLYPIWQSSYASITIIICWFGFGPTARAVDRQIFAMLISRFLQFRNLY